MSDHDYQFGPLKRMQERYYEKEEKRIRRDAIPARYGPLRRNQRYLNNKSSPFETDLWKLKD